MTVDIYPNEQPIAASFTAVNAKRAVSRTSPNPRLREVKKADGNCNETRETGRGAKQHRLACLRREQTPKEWHEPFILSGYRRQNLSTREYLWSAFSRNNECMNVWTHFLAAVVMIARYVSVAWRHTPVGDPMLYPLKAFALGTSSLYLISATAHALNSRSLRVQHVCFSFDYAAISIYTFAAGIAFYSYTRPLHSNLVLFDSPAVFLAFSALISFSATFLCCETRHKWKRARFVVRTLAYVVPWVYNSSPFISRVFFFTAEDPSTPEMHLIFRFCFYSFLIAGLVNASRIPERLKPGAFDFFGHSHNLMHIMTALGDQFAFSVYCIDLEFRRDELYASFAPTMWNTLAPTVLVMIGNLAIAGWFMWWLLLRTPDTSGAKYSPKSLNGGGKILQQ